MIVPNEKHVIEAEKAELIGGASKVADSQASGKYLVSLSKPGQARSTSISTSRI